MRMLLVKLVAALSLLAPLAVVTEAPASAHSSITHCYKQNSGGSNWAGLSYGNNNGSHVNCAFQINLKCERMNGTTYWKYKSRYQPTSGGGLTFLYCNSGDLRVISGSTYWTY